MCIIGRVRRYSEYLDEVAQEKKAMPEICAGLLNPARRSLGSAEEKRLYGRASLFAGW
jgi:hypothetical protein